MFDCCIESCKYDTVHVVYTQYPGSNANGSEIPIIILTDVLPGAFHFLCIIFV
jgi:hypothetical protein